MHGSLILLAIIITGVLGGADLNSISSEPDLIKRTRLALTNAEQVVAKAGKACKEGEYATCNEQLVEVKDSIELAMNSLEKTGINPRRNPRHFKDAEIRTRKILRRLEGVQSYLHPEDESHLRAILRRVSEINDKLLSAILTKNKK